MRLNLWTRQFLYTCLVAVGAILVMTLVVTDTSRQFVTSELQTNLKHAARLAAELVSELEAGFPAELQTRIAGLGKEIDTRLTVIDSSGRVLADSRADPEQMENHRSRPEVMAALRNGQGQATHRSRTISETMLYYAVRTRTRTGQLLVVRTSVSLAAVGRLWSSINRKLLLVAGILVLVALGLSVLSTRAVVRPVAELTRAAEQMAAGNFRTRVAGRRSDELGALTRAVNSMAGQLQKLFDAAGAERDLLQGVISSMAEGIIVIDRGRRVKLANRSFGQEFGVDETRIAGESFLQVLRSADSQGLVEQVFDSGKNATAEIRIGEKVFAATGVLLKGGRDEVALVLHDVTDLRRLAQVKADLVANVSHELRTPLTAIKGFVETLEAEVPEEQRRFLAIIERHTDRLIALVSDLLTLSQLESGERRLEKESLDLREVAADVLKMLEKRFLDKGLRVSVDSAPDTPRVNADRFLLEQVFINLLDNAAKYTQQGEVSVRIMPADRQVRIEVADTGPGIPAEYLPRIFERFYVVDKNRSRELGGTGLGLAIVRHIVLAHNGSVTAESALGKGTVFTILLPV